MGYGKKVWIFPDAELPPEGVNNIPGHESVIITNTGEEKEPVKGLCVTVGAGRVRCLRTNEEKDFGGYLATVGEQYAIMLESNVPIVAQYGRAETRAVAFYTTPGYNE